MKLPHDDLPSVLEGDAVASLDPLSADAIYQRLPEMNAQADVNAIVQALRSIVPTVETIQRMSMVELCAATRDLGMLLASIKRHGKEPIEAVPEVEAVLLASGARTGLIPRETLFHISVWNKRGPRQRLFTGNASEDVLLAATRMGVIAVERTLEALLPVLEIPFQSIDFPVGCMEVSKEVAVMVDAVKYTKEHIDPVFFARELRPYFEQIRIGDSRYSGAAAAVLAIGLVDHLLWSSDCVDEDYRHFQDENVQYTRPRWRKLYDAQLGLPSIATRLRRAMNSLEAGQDDWFNRACAGVAAILRVLLHFRGRHRVLAQSAYQPSVRLYITGSAGFGIDTLEHLITLTFDTSRKMRDAHAVGRSLTMEPPPPGSLRKPRPSLPPAVPRVPSLPPPPDES